MKIMRVLKAIASFHLELLPKEWVNNVWSGDCFDENELPLEFELQLEDKDFSAFMVMLIEAIEGWGSVESKESSRSSEDTSFSPKSWRILCNRRVDHKALICFISVFIKNDVKKCTREMRNLAFIASQLYLVLLSIPGSIAFNVFNPILYDRVLQLFTDISVLSFAKKKENSKFDYRDTANDCNLRNSLPDLSDVEKDDILREMYLLLDVLSKCLKELHLKDEEESLTRTIQTLVNLTQMETSISVFQNISKTNLPLNVVLKSYEILEQLCSSEHGEIEQIILKIMRYFLPTIVIREEDVKIAIKSHILFNINTFIFIQRLLQSHENDAVLGVKAVNQQLCVRMPDRTDIRSKVIPHIVQLLQLFTYSVFQDTVLWIVSLAHSDKLKYRLCAIEIIAKLLNASEISDFTASNNPINKDISIVSNKDFCGHEYVNTTNDKNENLLCKLLLGAILSRSLDVSPILRYKCLNSFASLVLSSQKVIKEIVKELFITPCRNFEDDISDLEDVPYFDFQNYFSTKTEKLSLPKNALPSASCLMKSVEMLAYDEKVFVRKSALHLISNICLLNKFWLTEKRMKIFVERCNDNSLMTRKFSVKCLTDLLLTYPSNKKLIEAWVQGVIPLIADSDVKCQEKVIESIGSIILDNLAEYFKTNNEYTKLPWEVLNAIAGNGKRILFRIVCQLWSIKKTITKNIFKMIETHIGTEHNHSAWFLIVCITEFQDCPDPKFVSNYFLRNIYNTQKTGEYISMLVVEAVFLNWRGLDRETQEEIYSRLRKSVESFTIPLILISRYLDICYIADRRETKTWSQKLVQKCEEYIRSYFATGSIMNICEPVLCQHIHTLGEACQFHPGVSNDIINYLAGAIDSTPIIGGITLKWQGAVSDKVKAVAIVTLGKICLQDLIFAKTYAPVLANALNDNSTDCVKINAMIALTDLCVRFTSVVEDYLGDMCAMLKDVDVNVRINCLKLLLQLVQEDYLKPKGALFFYLLIALRDPIASVRDITESFISNVLLKRNPSIMSQFFIQAIFFFNDYEGIGSFSKENLTAKERKVFSLAGITNFNERGSIYKYMLSNMKDDHRFKLCNRICVDILDEVIDGHIPLEKIGSAVLKDALFAMACDEMRLENLRKIEEDSSDKESEDALEEGRSEAVLGIAKKAFISRIVKANYVDSIVPTISKLKRILAEMKSPLVRDLMICLRELMKDFREEINDILHSDAELAAEVSLDLKNISKEEDSHTDIYGDFNIKEVRVNCERLSEKVLCEKMGISNLSIKSLQSQSMAIFRSKSPLLAEIPVNHNSTKDQDPIIQNSQEIHAISAQLSVDKLDLLRKSNTRNTRSSVRISPVKEETCRRNMVSPYSGGSNSMSSSPESFLRKSLFSSSSFEDKYRRLSSSQESGSSTFFSSDSSLEITSVERNALSQESNRNQLSDQKHNKITSKTLSSGSSNSIKRIKSKKRTNKRK